MQRAFAKDIMKNRLKVLRAERDGTVKKIHAAAGATLAVDALILEFA